MSIVRILGYGLLGYTLYQLTYGLRNEMSQRQGDEGSGEEKKEQSRPQSAQRQGSGGGGGGRGRSNMTGPGRGTRVSTIDSSGESVSHNVGRGVVS